MKKIDWFPGPVEIARVQEGESTWVLDQWIMPGRPSFEVVVRKEDAFGVTVQSVRVPVAHAAELFFQLLSRRFSDDPVAAFLIRELHARTPVFLPK